MTDVRPAAELRDYLRDEKELTPESWRELVPDPARPVELEVGCGKGLFLSNAAQARPDHHFIGVEIARKYARRTADRAAKRDLSNVRVIAGDAYRFLVTQIPDQSLAAVHVYFPDPWWKKRHKKRRVFREEFAAQVERALAPGGVLSIATDVEEYFGVMREVVAGRPAFRELPPPEPGEPQHDLDYLTNFERKFRIEGRPIYRARYAVGSSLADPS